MKYFFEHALKCLQTYVDSKRASEPDPTDLFYFSGLPPLFPWESSPTCKAINKKDAKGTQTFESSKLYIAKQSLL